MEDIKHTRVNRGGRSTTRVCPLAVENGGGVCGRHARGCTLFEVEAKVTVPNKVTALICWRLDAGNVFLIKVCNSGIVRLAA